MIQSYDPLSNLLGRLLFPRGRQSGCLEDSSAVPPTASTTPASGGAAERRLLFHRSALRVTKVSPGDVGRRIRRVVRRCALFLLTSLLFAISMNVFFNSIKWFLHLPQNATTVNATMELGEVVDSPALLIYLLNCAFIIFIPFSLVIAICLERRAENLLGLFTAYVIQLTEGHATWSVLLCRSFGLNTLWTLNLYCIARSLRNISVTDMTLLVCVLPPYGYLFSWILVPKKFVAFRIVALILASCGMLFLTYFDPNNIGSKIIAICGVVLQALFATIRRNLVGDITVSRVTAFYGFLGLTHTLLTWPLFVTTSVLTSFEPISWGREILWLHDPAYFDKVRIASCVLVVGGGLITTLPTRLYEQIEDWIQRRQSPISVHQSASTAPSSVAVAATAPLVAVSTGGEALGTTTTTTTTTTTQSIKPTASLAGNLIASPANESTNRRTTLVLPITRRRLFRSSSLSVNRGK
ncbi:solute carrier family 35 member F3 [Echinococcus multilocularis]|uniref:Solute carrier family 35 member F3 n=1 Tax=Echinococcus multilocularis TaxID=6211 RepID=A0A087VZD7_ECHMU|nr:solute carrier family 35 member F3 [Echinococcus multilocularis]